MDTPYYYYTILDVPNDATPSDIKRAYRKKALQYHPDKCKEPHSADKFKDINQAFHVLSDKDKRHFYDSFGGVERPEIPMTISKPFEDFCEGVALGTLGFFANMGMMALFGIPFGASFTGWVVISQLLTAWQMVPPTLEEAKDFRNWCKALGAFVSPVFLLTSASCVVGYTLLNGSKLALEYTKDKMGAIGASVAGIGDQVRKAVHSFNRDSSLSLTTDDCDWVMLEEDKSKRKKRSTPSLIDSPKTNSHISISDFESLPSSSSSFDTSSDALDPYSLLPLKPSSSPQADQSEDWVLLDDML